MSLDEETDEEQVFLLRFETNKHTTTIFTTLIFLCSMDLKKWTEQLLNVRTNIGFQILSYHFMLDTVEKEYGINLEVFSSWIFQSCLSAKKQMKNEFFLIKI